MRDLRVEHVREAISPRRASMSPARGVSDTAYAREIDRDSPIAKLLSQDHFLRSRTHLWMCRRALWQARSADQLERPTGRGDGIFQSTDVTEIPLRIHAVPGGMREQRRSSETIGSRTLFRGVRLRNCARTAGPPRLAISLDFFFSIRVSRTIEQRLASTTRFRIVVCGRSTSPKRKVARTATERSHHTVVFVPLRTRYQVTGGSRYHLRIPEVRPVYLVPPPVRRPRDLKRRVNRRTEQRRTYYLGIPRLVSIHD